MLLSIKAAACHAAWYAYTVIGRGEPGMPYWAASPEQIKSTEDGVRKMDQIVDSEDFANMDLEKLCFLMHENWMQFKVQSGWRYGKVKDLDKKEHPCLVSYDKLPQEEKNKDKVFIQAYLSIKSLEYNSKQEAKDTTQSGNAD
jgi:hypothetical protein